MKVLLLFFFLSTAFGAKDDVTHIKSDGLPIKTSPTKIDAYKLKETEVYKIISIK